MTNGNPISDILAGKVLGPAAQAAIMDPTTRAALEFQAAQTIQSPAVRAALRPFAIELAIYVGIAVFAGGFLALQFRR